MTMPSTRAATAPATTHRAGDAPVGGSGRADTTFSDLLALAGMSTGAAGRVRAQPVGSQPPGSQPPGPLALGSAPAAAGQAPAGFEPIDGTGIDAGWPEAGWLDSGRMNSALMDGAWVDAEGVDATPVGTEPDDAAPVGVGPDGDEAPMSVPTADLAAQALAGLPVAGLALAPAVRQTSTQDGGPTVSSAAGPTVDSAADSPLAQEGAGLSAASTVAAQPDAATAASSGSAGLSTPGPAPTGARFGVDPTTSRRVARGAGAHVRSAAEAARAAQDGLGAAAGPDGPNDRPIDGPLALLGLPAGLASGQLPHNRSAFGPAVAASGAGSMTSGPGGTASGTAGTTAGIGIATAGQLGLVGQVAASTAAPSAAPAAGRMPAEEATGAPFVGSSGGSPFIPLRAASAGSGVSVAPVRLEPPTAMLAPGTPSAANERPTDVAPAPADANVVPAQLFTVPASVPVPFGVTGADLAAAVTAGDGSGSGAAATSSLAGTPVMARHRADPTDRADLPSPAAEAAARAAAAGLGTATAVGRPAAVTGRARVAGATPGPGGTTGDGPGESGAQSGAVGGGQRRGAAASARTPRIAFPIGHATPPAAGPTTAAVQPGQEPVAIAGTGSGTALSTPEPVIDQVTRHLLAARTLRDGTQRSVLHLMPAGLGAVRVTVDVRAGRVSLDLAAADGAIAALSQELPALRSQLAEAGLDLADVTLNRQDAGPGDGRRSGQDGAGGGPAGSSPNTWDGADAAPGDGSRPSTSQTGGEPPATGGTAPRPTARHRAADPVPSEGRVDVRI
jgi:hypothetical protein